MKRRIVLAFGVLTLAAPVARGQVPTDDVGSCALLADPTAQRACIESAQQKRPAAAFDPSVRTRARRNAPPVEDTTGLRGGGASGSHLPAKARGTPAIAPSKTEAPSAEPVPQMP